MVISCKKESNSWEGISKKLKGFNFLILCGGYKFGDYYFDKNILHLNCNDFYEGLPEKVIGGFLVIEKENRFKDISHVIKMDSNNSIPENNIQNILLKIKSLQKYDYFGQKLTTYKGIANRKYHFGKVRKSSKWHNKEYKGDYCDWLHGGYSYCLSRKSMKIIENEYNLTNYKSCSDKYIFEDIMIALILKKNQIFPIEKDIGIIPDKRENISSFNKFKRKIKKIIKFFIKIFLDYLF